jgi:phosphoribosylanthranilate isomerase
MAMIRFDATILEPEELPAEVQASFASAIEARGASDLRVNADEGQVAVSFLLDAESEREALVRGSEITLAALAPFTAVRWVSSGVTYWDADLTDGS